MRISDWSSDVCSSDLAGARRGIFWGHLMQQVELSATLNDQIPTLAVWLSGACFNVSVFSGTPKPDRGVIRILTPGERSEERRVGKECVSTCRSRWCAYH